MSVPTHGPWCTTLNYYRFTCTLCSKEVFFFSCTCGSRVLFDGPDPAARGWPKHADSCWPTMVDEQIRSGATASDARYEVMLKLRRAGRTIPDALNSEWKRCTKNEAARRRSAKRTLYAKVAPDEPRDFPGRVMSVERNVNMLKLFDLPPNEIGRQLLGKRGKSQWHRLGLREHGADELGIVAEMSALISASDLTRSGIRIGQRVLVSVAPWAPPHRDPAWIVTEASIIG